MSSSIPGNPSGIKTLAHTLAQRGTEAETAASTLDSAKADITGGTLRLKGGYASTIHDTIDNLPSELRKLGRGYSGCGKALDAYAITLENAQTKARQGQDARDVADREHRNAELDLDALQPGWESSARDLGYFGDLAADTFGDASGEVHAAMQRRETAEQNQQRASKLLDEARELRSDGEQTCAREIKNALEDSGIKNKSFWQKAGNYLKESFTTWDGFVKLCENISTVLGVVAIFLSGPLALVVGAILLATAIVAMANTLKQFRDGKIGWKEMAFAAAGTVASRFGGRVAMRGLKAMRRTKTVKAFSDRTHGAYNRLADRKGFTQRSRDRAHRGICAVTGHPVDISTGKVFTDFTDLELPGPLPFTFERVWYSTSTYAGSLGHGWHHSFDARLWVTAQAVVYHTPDGRAIDLLPLDPGTSYYEREERLTVARDDAGYRLTTSTGLLYRFSPVPSSHLDLDAPPGETEPVTYVLRGVVSRAGHRISLSYDDDQLVEIFDSGGRSLQFGFDAEGRMTELTAPHPDRPGERFAVARYGYDPRGNLTSMTDALGQVFRYEYAEHLLVRETDRNGLSFYFEYDGTDESARCHHTWGDGGIYNHRLAYAADETTVTNSLGHRSSYRHDGGLVVRSVDALGGERRTRYEYQQPVEEIDPLGRVTTYRYDHRGNVVETVTPDGAVVTAEFDERDLPVSAVDAVGGVWLWGYDEAGLLTSRSDPLEAVSTFRYRSGLLTELVDPAGGSTRLSYDAAGSLTEVTTPDQASSGWRRNALGWPLAARDPLGNEQVRTFDLAGRVVAVDEPDGNQRSLSYDGEGNVLHAVDQLYDVRFGYSGMGRMVSRTQAGTTVQFEYDTEEQLTGIINEHGYAYSFGLGATGEVMSERGFDGILRLYEHDVAGRVVSVRRASGLMTRYGYDFADRIVTIHNSDGTGETASYRADGALMTAENTACLIRFERDLLGRVTREFQNDHWVASEYNSLGQRTRMHSSLGANVVYERDAIGAVSAMAVSQGPANWSVSFERDGIGQELRRSLPGGVQARWHRDEQGSVVHREVTVSGGVLHNRFYDWTFDKRLVSMGDTRSGHTQFKHDGLGQLVSSTDSSGREVLRMPDEVGSLFQNHERFDRAYGRSGQILTVHDADQLVTFLYDAEGNLIGREGSDGEAWAYFWSADGNLSEVVLPSSERVTLIYDPFGRRLGKASSERTVHWLWDGDDPLHEWYDETLATPIKTYAFGTNNWELLAYFEDGQSHSILSDSLGAVKPEPPFVLKGGVKPSLSPSDLNFRWPGQYFDRESGLLYNRFRYLNPEIEQYISQDPIGLRGGLGLYSYVHDPTTWSDPAGLSSGKSARTLTDDELYENIHIRMYRNKKEIGGGDMHGLVHRFQEQIEGPNRPGTGVWRRHENVIKEQQGSMRSFLRELERRDLKIPNRAWKMATVSPPSGNQRRLPPCMK